MALQGEDIGQVSRRTRHQVDTQLDFGSDLPFPQSISGMIIDEWIVPSLVQELLKNLDHPVTNEPHNECHLALLKVFT